LKNKSYPQPFPEEREFDLNSLKKAFQYFNFFNG